MYQLKTRQICLFFIAFVPVTKFLLLPSMIAGFSANDMWISALINFIFDIISIVGICVTLKRTKTDFFTLLENCFGEKGSKIILIIYALLFFLKALIPVNDLRNYVEITLYETIPSSIYFLPFFFVCFYLCVKPLRVIGRCADVMWLVSLLGVFIIMALSISNVKVQNVLPVGVNGAKNIINGSISTSLWYGDGVYLMFFIGNFAYKKYDDVKIILSYALTGLIVILFMIFFYAIFTSIAHRQTYSLTEISKYSTVINNIGRFDYIGIALILFSNMFASILPLFFTTLLISRAFKVKNKWPISLIVTGCLFFIITFLKEYFLSIDNFIFYYGNYAFLIAFNIVPLLSPLLTLKEKKYAPTKT